MGKKRRQPRGAPSTRQHRASELVRRELTEALRDIKDPRLQETMVTITEVKMSPDLYYATVYVSVLEESEEVRSRVVAGLDSAKGTLRRQLGVLGLKQTPDLRFHLDESLALGARIEGILADIDVPPADEPSDAPTPAADVPTPDE